MLIGIDTGGTFTDFVIYDGRELRTYKVPSTPEDPSKAILSGLEQVSGTVSHGLDIVHGSTVATNALLERKGARLALITTEGFEDVIEIGRQNRGELYNIFWEAPKPLVDKSCRLGIKERTTFEGRVESGVKTADLKKLLIKLKKLPVEGIALSFLHSYANPANEKRVTDYLRSLDIPVSVSSEILPEFREYERTSTVVANSYLLPKVRSYMNALSQSINEKGDRKSDTGNKKSKSKIAIMQSSGGVITPEQAADEPVRILLSGPAGGVVGSFGVASQMGYRKVIGYDMGGTSTDVSLCDGAPGFSTEASIDGVAVKVPMIDITTIGAGGGSIAYVDSGGVLKVGPQSAGADPGPACYGKGALPTVTDANLVLGRIDPTWFLGGRMRIYPSKSKTALNKLAQSLKMSAPQVAEGVIKVANANMERALRVISIGRGYDPRDFALMSFGGAGGLHACELARDLEISTVIFPKDPGVLSAMGMLMADTFRDYSLTRFLDERKDAVRRLGGYFKELEQRAKTDLSGGKLKFERYLDMRYKRQAHEITVPFTKNFIRVFHREHKKLFGYMKPENETEVVTLRLRAVSKKKKLVRPELEAKKRKVSSIKSPLVLDGKEVSAKIYMRDEFYPGFKFGGPAIVLEKTATLFITHEYKCEVDRWGNIRAEI